MQLIQKRMQELAEILEHHNKLYYELDKIEIPDGDYDMLFKELQELEALYPEWTDRKILS